MVIGAIVSKEIVLCTGDVGNRAFLQGHVRGAAPIVESIGFRGAEVLKTMAESIVMDLCRTGRKLRQFHNCKRHVGAASYHGIDKFTDTLSVANAHTFGQGLLDLNVGITSGIKELLHKCLTGGKGRQTAASPASGR